GEAARTARFAVKDDVDGSDFAVLCEEVAQRPLLRLVIEITYKNLGQQVTCLPYSRAEISALLRRTRSGRAVPRTLKSEPTQTGQSAMSRHGACSAVLFARPDMINANRV